MNPGMYRIVLHQQVLSKDLKDLDSHEIERIFRAIKGKLEMNPVQFGKPLRKDLKGYYRLRVDFYRIIYQINKGNVTVFIIKIGKRKEDDAYVDAQKRL